MGVCLELEVAGCRPTGSPPSDECPADARGGPPALEEVLEAPPGGDVEKVVMGYRGAYFSTLIAQLANSRLYYLGSQWSKWL